MTHFKKYIVVPFVSTIEKPSENFIENADKTMSDTITDTKMPDDLKMKIYHQNLNKFLLKYDPNTYGVTPMLAKLAQSVTEFIDKAKEQEKPNQAYVKEELPNSPLFKNEFTTPASILKNKFNDSYNYKKDTDYDMDGNNYKLNPDFTINASNIGDNESQLDNTLLDNYEKSAQPYLNTRNQKQASHSYGVYGDYDPKENITIRSKKIARTPPLTPKNPKTAEFNKDSKFSENKYKGKRLQNGHGKSKWATKKFF